MMHGFVWREEAPLGGNFTSKGNGGQEVITTTLHPFAPRLAHSRTLLKAQSFLSNSERQAEDGDSILQAPTNFETFD